MRTFDKTKSNAKSLTYHHYCYNQNGGNGCFNIEQIGSVLDKLNYGSLKDCEQHDYTLYLQLDRQDPNQVLIDLQSRIKQVLSRQGFAVRFTEISTGNMRINDRMLPFVEVTYDFFKKLPPPSRSLNAADFFESQNQNQIDTLEAHKGSHKSSLDNLPYSLSLENAKDTLSESGSKFTLEFPYQHEAANGCYSIELISNFFIRLIPQIEIKLTKGTFYLSVDILSESPIQMNFNELLKRKFSNEIKPLNCRFTTDYNGMRLVGNKGLHIA